MSDPRDDLADRLAAVAVELIGRVREYDPADVHRWLVTEVAGVNEWIGLTMILAAVVPDDQPWSELKAWVTQTQRTSRRRRTWREAKQRSRQTAA